MTVPPKCFSETRRLRSLFDVVVMLTWSDWKTEPRSNRYHYGVRFARELPVLFVQPWAAPGTPLKVEASGTEGIDLVQVTWKFEADQVSEMLRLLRDRGYKRPLVWIYDSVHYNRLIDAMPNAYRVYHATENYVTESASFEFSQSEVSSSVLALLPSIDLLVAVSPGVARAYVERRGYTGALIIAENGCDAGFFFDVSNRMPKASSTSPPVAIYQGGINKRLDFPLLHRLVHLLPNWQFWFCGPAETSRPDWKALTEHPNVRYFGVLESAELAKVMCSATVGLIPFETSDWIHQSLPLKAFEYVACGLPVVTVPVEALEKLPSLFSTAKSAEEFSCAMVALSTSRHDPDKCALRRKAAEERSYDRRFEAVVGAVQDGFQTLKSQPRILNVAVLYDDRWSHIGTVREHVEAFRLYSRHEVHFIPGTYATWTTPITGRFAQHWSTLNSQVDLSIFDVVICHYSVRVALPDYLNEGFARQLEAYNGLKILFIQDEYDATETARRCMDRLQFDIVYTCVPPEGKEHVYPSYRYPATDFLRTLTGYVPEVPSIERFSRPLREREVRIGYRGRILHPVYGDLARQKQQIGVEVKRLAEERGVRVDIEVDDAKRIYGEGWYKFLGSARATLGTESGANIFDFDGSIRKAVDTLLAQDPLLPFDEVHRRLLAPHEGRVRMNQISPKVFEAIRLRTALVLFDGDYSGIVKRDLHFIPLATDYSNIDEVFRKIEDLDYLEELTERAYREVIGSGRYSYKQFVAGVDSDIESRVVRGAKYELFSTPVLARAPNGATKVLIPQQPIGFAVSSRVLGETFQREEIAEAFDRRDNSALGPEPSSPAQLPACPNPDIPVATTPPAPGEPAVAPVTAAEPVASPPAPAASPPAPAASPTAPVASPTAPVASPPAPLPPAATYGLSRAMWRALPAAWRILLVKGLNSARVRYRQRELAGGPIYRVFKFFWSWTPSSLKRRVRVLLDR